MYILVVRILPIIIGIMIAYAIARAGMKKQIGFWWSLYFGLIFPLLGLMMVIFSRKKNATLIEKNVVWKPLSILMLLFGFVFIYGGFTTKITEIKTVKVYSGTPINTTNETANLILNDSSENVGRVLGIGVLSQTLKLDAYLVEDYRSIRFYRYFIGILLISLASFILTRKFSSAPIQTKIILSNRNYTFDENAQFQSVLEFKSNKSEEKIEQAIKGAPVIEEKSMLQTYIYSKERKVQNIRHLGISTFAGFILGWYYKVPNSENLIGLSECDSLWRKNLIIDLQKKNSSFFSTDLFSFNWLVFFFTTLICFMLLLFFTDEKFRQYLYDKLTFRKEKEAL